MNKLMISFILFCTVLAFITFMATNIQLFFILLLQEPVSNIYISSVFLVDMLVIFGICYLAVR